VLEEILGHSAEVVQNLENDGILYRRPPRN
jgi:hypothetical protein